MVMLVLKQFNNYFRINKKIIEHHAFTSENTFNVLNNKGKERN